jgi:outer membrane receptor protein involved in Fe transport
MQRKLLFVLLVTAMLPALLYAAPGKIKGKVVDAGTGEALVGANVVVVGTSMGAATNTVGEYVILNVPVGTYTLKTSYVGYQQITVSNVRVNSDLTTEQNFQLPSEGVTVAAVEITAERPLVNKSATNVTRIIDQEFFANIPGRGTNLAISIQPGVVVQNNNVYIRGSRPDETGFVVDGVDVSNKLAGGSGLYLPDVSVEQIQVQAGGYTAEYGNANAGIVSAQLRTGSPTRWNASLIAETDRYTQPGSKDLGGYSYGYSDYTATLGGPIIADKLRIFGSVQNTYYVDQNVASGGGLQQPYRFTNLVTDPTFSAKHPTTALSDTIPLVDLGGIMPANPSNRWAVAGTMTLDLGKLQVRGGGSYSYFTSRNAAPLVGANISLPVNQNTGWANYLDQERERLNVNRDGFGNLKVSYLFSPTTFLEVNGNYYTRTRNQTDPYWGWNLWAYGDSALNAAQGWYLYKQGQNFNNYSFYNGAIGSTVSMQQPGQPLVDNPYRDRWDQWGGRADFTTQINQHLIKAGGEFTVAKYRRYNPVGAIAWAQYLKQAHSASELEVLLNSGSGTGSDVIGYDIYGNEVSSDVVKNGALYYMAPPKPVNIAAYIQDKIELSDIILNIGLRWDYINPDSRTTADPGNLAWNSDNLLTPDMYEKTPATSVVSPRVGFSYPVTDRTVFHAQYGRFIQQGRLNDSYAGPAAISGITKAGYWATAGVTGWGLLPEKDTQYELGFNQAISDNASFDITAFYKDVRDQIQFIGIAPTPGSTTQSYHAMANKDFSTSKGIEVVFSLRRTERISAQLNYTFSDARSTASDQLGSNGIWQLGLGPASLPKYVFPVNFDQAHRGSVLLDYRFAKDDGGPILSQLGANIVLSFNSGHAYTRMDVAGRYQTTDNRNRTPLEPIGSSTTPWFFQLDMRLDKTLPVGPIDLNLYVYVINLLGTNNPVNAFLRTGDPMNDGYLQTAGGIADAASYGSDFVELYNALLNGINQGNYGPPRQIRFGFKIDY